MRKRGFGAELWGILRGGKRCVGSGLGKWWNIWRVLLRDTGFVGVRRWGYWR
jgi:hypothetical protein